MCIVLSVFDPMIFKTIFLTIVAKAEIVTCVSITIPLHTIVYCTHLFLLLYQSPNAQIWEYYVYSAWVYIFYPRPLGKTLSDFQTIWKVIGVVTYF